MGGAQHNADRRLLGVHLWSEPKDARDAVLRWSTSTVTRRMQFDVYLGELVLPIYAEVRDQCYQQFRLHHPSWYAGLHPLVRLCVVEDHGCTPHWHVFEAPGEPRDDRPIYLPDGADLADPGYLLVEVFLRTLNVDRYSYEGSFDA